MGPNVAVAVSSALGAAVLFALATSLQSRALRRVASRTAATPAPARPTATAGMVTELRHLRRAAASRAWLLGTAIGVGAFALHALALHEGDLTVVQPLLVTMVLFALPANHLVAGTPVTSAEWLWGILLLVALTVFFAAGDPASRATAAVDLGPAIIATVVALLAVVACVGLAWRHPGGPAAALLGGAAGIAFAGVAALVKATTNLLGDGFATLMGSWQLYAVLVVGAIGIVLSQVAYRSGPLSASLPALNSVNPLASVLIGVAVFDERFRTGLISTGIETLALLAMTVAVVALSRQSVSPRVAAPSGLRPPGAATAQPV